eukprot:SM000010S04368  [mRNA]  locus=s10:1122820:1123119:+ [translate_table: standard]
MEEIIVVLHRLCSHMVNVVACTLTGDHLGFVPLPLLDRPEAKETGSISPQIVALGTRVFPTEIDS